ncbi:MAG: hypothetical protein PHV33_13240 [Elusimicrobiales bacterium]|nr:hypothetical protein [Elusimicrobiales bacterium]
MTKNELTWLLRNMRYAPAERIKVWELRDNNHGKLLARDATGRMLTWVVRASSCYKRMCPAWDMRLKHGG